ncbi:MAG: RsmD family RNA methyltransferase, partial [Pseudomonadota bacterium]|nr:RsmD family RNA methyltransferase [Pseudomonadota bacterium]
VLDLFAGSGALGLESLSRGAASAILVERDPMLAASLRRVVARLDGGEAATVVQADAVAWASSQGRETFDVAFLDPPFGLDLWPRILPAVLPALAPLALLYLESPAGVQPALPAGWSLHREGGTREVRFALYRRSPGAG